MITQEMMNVASQSRMSDVAKAQLEHDALAMSKKRAAKAPSRQTGIGFHLPSFVVRILSPATAS